MSAADLIEIDKMRFTIRRDPEILRAWARITSFGLMIHLHFSPSATEPMKLIKTFGPYHNDLNGMLHAMLEIQESDRYILGCFGEGYYALNMVMAKAFVKLMNSAEPENV